MGLKKSITKKIIENFSNCGKEEEKFINYNNNHLGKKNYSTYELIILIIFAVVMHIILLIFGKFLWNNYVSTLFTVVKPVENIWQLLALSILVKLIIY